MNPPARTPGCTAEDAGLREVYLCRPLTLPRRSFVGALRGFISGALWSFISVTVGLSQAQQDASLLQTAAPLSATPAKLLQVFQQEQKSLMKERRALVASGETRQQLQAWRQQNASRFQAQQQRAQALSAASAVRPMSGTVHPNIPANASPTLRDYLITQTALANARVQLHNQMLQGMSANSSKADTLQTNPNERQLFLQQHAADLQLQRQRAQTLSVESASVPLPVPKAVVIPANATPQMKAYLIARNELMVGRAQVWNQNLNANPATRQAAIAQWRQQNAAQVAQFRQMAQPLSTSGTTSYENQ